MSGLLGGDVTFATWLIPLALSALVFGLVGLASLDGQSESPTRRRSLDPDGLRITGTCVLALGGLAAMWIGVGDHEPRSVLSGRAPFDWSAACAVGSASVLIGGGLLLAGWLGRRRRVSATEPVQRST